MTGLRLEPRRRATRRLGRGRLLVVAGLLGLAALASAQPLDPSLLERIGIDQKLDGQVPLELVFRDEAGQEVALGQIFGARPVVLSLVYYECPMLCTQVLNGLLRTLRAVSLDVGRDFDVVTISIDPAETQALAAAKHAEYASQYGRPGAATGWHFLTGDQDQIAQLAEAVGFRYVCDAEKDICLHASAIMVATPQGRLARYFYGIEYSPKDLRLGLVEASRGRIGSPVDQLLLLCYHYDPETGRYGLIIFSSLRAAGMLTAGVLAGFVALMLWRERRHREPAPPAATR
ncbi:MAG: SCO family protein [Gemmatimonadota bacterium]